MNISEPVKVPVSSRPLGVLGTVATARRNVLELIPSIAYKQPIVSGRTGLRWHMALDPDGLRHNLKHRVEDYPESTITKLLLEPALGNSMFTAEGA